MKIQIIGYSGSGKSHYAKKLARIFNIPCLHLDNVQFYGDWQIRTLEEKNSIVRDFLSNNDNWVIDGNYHQVAPERFEMSDITIYLNFNRFYCYKKAKFRYKKYKGIHRDSNPCIEKFDFKFRKWVFWSGRKKERRKRMITLLNKTNGEKHMFKNIKQLNAWIDNIVGHSNSIK